MNELEVQALALFLFSSVLTIAGSGHALLNKRDPRSALAWIAMCVALPFLGVLLYYVFGKNRIKTRAQRMQCDNTDLTDDLAQNYQSAGVLPDYENLVRLSEASSNRPLLGGNTVEALHNGEEAYPAMLLAIAQAQSYIYLTSYIFESRKIGQQFINALSDAKERGVKVKVLVDGVGEKYDFPFISRRLRKKNIAVALYLPPTLFPPNLTINLRNHRKLLLVDGEVGFTGGMNIRQNHIRKDNPKGFVDIHFSILGPVLRQLEGVFINDWLFSTGEQLIWNTNTRQLDSSDDMSCRVLLEGPNEDIDKLTWVLVGAISLAQRSLRIMTPYFLPSRELEVALQTAALRGVDVSVVLPGKNNLPFMTWATNHILPSLIATGVKVYHSPGPFVHSKLFVVDDYYVQLGSSNLDPRSLMLNFELMVEVYDQDFGKRMGDHVRSAVDEANIITGADLRHRGLVRRLRDAFFWLFSPYL